MSALEELFKTRLALEDFPIRAWAMRASWRLLTRSKNTIELVPSMAACTRDRQQKGMPLSDNKFVTLAAVISGLLALTVSRRS
jgi:hypothetical protein